VIGVFIVNMCNVIKQGFMTIAASLGSVVLSKSIFQPKQTSQMLFTSLGSSAGTTCLSDSFLKEHKKGKKTRIKEGKTQRRKQRKTGKIVDFFK